MARAVREDALHRPDAGGARGHGAAGTRPARSLGERRARGGRHQERDVRLPPPGPHRGRDRRDVLRRRDQEVDLHRHERPPAAGRRLPDALLGERRRRRARRGLLRALGHGEDDALGGPRAAPDRRRRARLVGRRDLQLRGRLLREGDPALGGGRAGDLRDDARIRHGARERRHGRARRPRSRRRLEDGEHARGLQAGADRERAPREARRDAVGRRLPHRGRVRDPAADRTAHARAGDVLVPLRVHGEARRHGDRRDRAAAHVLGLLRRAVPARSLRRCTQTCSGSGSSGTRTSASGS